MQLRHVKRKDVDELFHLFQSVAVKQVDLSRTSVPKSGFYEYTLSFEEFSQRAASPRTLVIEGGGRIVAYMISYSLDFARSFDNFQDPVLMRLGNLDGSVTYHDQLYLEQGMPHHLASRLFYKMDTIAEGEKAPGVITAVPLAPWKNESSTKLVGYQGFKLTGQVQEPELTLALFTKPFLRLDTPFEDLEKRLI